MQLQLKNLKVVKSSRTILKGVSVDIEKGSFLGLVGANGSGKSTLLNAILGIDKIAEGSMTCDAKNIAYVPQHFAIETFHLPITVEELVKTGLRSERAKGANALIDTALKELDILAFKQRRLQQLSGGERQKALLARALVSSPDLLLLDEPMSALDEPSRERVFKVLKGKVEKGTTVLIVSHDLEMLAQSVNRVICLKEGQIHKECHTVDLKGTSLSEIFDSEHVLHHHCHA